MADILLACQMVQIIFLWKRTLKMAVIAPDVHYKNVQGYRKKFIITLNIIKLHLRMRRKN
jgi:hypothetical protein